MDIRGSFRRKSDRTSRDLTTTRNQSKWHYGDRGKLLYLGRLDRRINEKGITMKKYFALISLFLMSLNAFAISGIAVPGSIITNPTTSQVLVSVTIPASGSIASPPSANY